MKIEITLPSPALIVLVGPSCSGKSTFAKRHFKDTEVISSDYCRAMIGDDENDMDTTDAAFRVLHKIVDERLKYGKLTVVDATNIRSEDRRQLVSLARQNDFFSVALVFKLEQSVLRERHKLRTDRDFEFTAIKRQVAVMGRRFKVLKREGFRQVHVFSSEEEMNAVKLIRRPLWTVRKEEQG
ncbi:MAG: AAA family ATPase, partial [Lentisphaeraceae bacterium]|nr:AAA family ATPase [Lentisphaeraceae bacterium]